MNYRIAYFLAFYFLALSFGEGRAQNTFEKQIDLGSAATGNSLIATSDGGYLVGGYIDSVNLSSYFPCLVKFDVNGNVQWAKFLDKNKTGDVTALAESSDGNFFAAGYIAIDSNTAKSFIMKFDAVGNTKWIRVFENSTYDIPLSSCDDGGLLLAGSFNTLAPFVMRIAADGSLLWEESFETKPRSYFRSITHLSDGSYVIVSDDQGTKPVLVISLMKIELSGFVTWYRTVSTSSDLFGWSSCKTADGGFAVCGTTIPSQDDKNVYVAKFDSSGSLLWGKEIDAFSFEEGLSIAEGLNGDVVIACFGNPTGAMILRIDKNGTAQSLKTLVGANFFSLSSIASSSDGGFVFTGTIRDSGSSSGKVILEKIDAISNGCHLEDRLFSDRPSGIVTTQTVTTSFGGVLDTADIKLGADINFKEIDLCDVSSVTVPSSEKESISLSPNPLISGKSVTIHINKNLPFGNYDLTLLDLPDNTIKKEKINLTGAKQDILFDVSECAAGVYIIELRSEREPGIVHRMKLIKEN